MSVSEQLGEREIIETLWKQMEKMARMPVPFGDDVSAFSVDSERLAVLKTDMLVGKTDVPPNMSLWQAARKAVVMNVSDFAAKGVKPSVMLISLGLPRGFTKAKIEEIGKGLNAGAREYGAYIIGGDTGEASDLVISVSLFGLAPKKSLMLRSGAKEGDFVAVTGAFGRTAAGLKLLLGTLSAETDDRDTLVESVLMPHARLKEGLALGRTQVVTAAIDSSDGLAWSLHEIARSSKVGFLIDKLPAAEEAVKVAAANRLDPSELVLYGGEEYELVVTVKPKLWNKAADAVKQVGGKLLLIGKVTRGRQVFLKVDGEKHVVEPRGWEHFKSCAC